MTNSENAVDDSGDTTDNYTMFWPYLFLIFLGLTTQVSARPLFLLKDNATDAQYGLAVSYLTTQDNLDDSGEIVELTSDNYYDQYLAELYARWVLSSRWGLHVRSGVSYFESQNNTSVQSNTGIRPISVGVDRHISGQKFKLVGDLALTIPFHSYDYETPLNNEMFISEEAFVLAPKLWLQYDLNPILLYGFIGFDYRFEGRSSVVPYQLSLDWSLSDFTIGGGFDGFVLAIEDEKQAIDRQALNTVIGGGSLKYNAADPSLHAVNVWGGYKITSVSQIRAGLTHPIAGQSTWYGPQFFVHLAYIEDPSAHQSYLQRRKRQKQRPTSPDQFEAHSDPSYDKYFREDGSRRKSPKQPESSLDDELNEIEKQLEQSGS